MAVQKLLSAGAIVDKCVSVSNQVPHNFMLDVSSVLLSFTGKINMDRHPFTWPLDGS